MSSIDINSLVKVPCKLDISFFRYWLMFLKPFHDLTNRDIDVASYYLLKRYELINNGNELSLIKGVLFSKENESAVIDLFNLKYAHFHVIMSKLKKMGFFVDGDINKRYIPKVTNNKNFKMMLYFDFQ